MELPFKLPVTRASFSAIISTSEGPKARLNVNSFDGTGRPEKSRLLLSRDELLILATKFSADADLAEAANRAIIGMELRA